SSVDCGRVYVCPHIPPSKEQVARRAHIAHLPDRERILALYDATWFGEGDEGLLVTARRLCWKNIGESARAIEWRDIDPDQLETGGRLPYVGNEPIVITEEEVLDACLNAFHVLAFSGLPPRPSSSGLVVPENAPRSTPTLATAPPPYTESFATYAS